MANHFCLPELRLTREIAQYRIVHDTIPHQPFFASSTFAFNTGGASIKLEGRYYTGDSLFCFSSEPNMQILQKGEGEVILVDVRLGALYRLFGFDGAQYSGSIVEADPIRFPQLTAISEKLDTALKTLDSRVAVLNETLIALAEKGRPYGIGEKFQFIADLTKGNIRVDAAAERLCVSTRTLERDCRRRFGRTPKRILRGWRISHALSTADSDVGPVRWTATDPDANYSDQAHFLRDHREIGGLNPTEMYEANHALNTENIYHPRGRLSASLPPNSLQTTAEYRNNLRFQAYGRELAQELNLMDWYLLRST